MKMISITIVQMRHATDKVYITTDLPDGTHPYTGTLDLTFNVAKGTAKEYCEKHFPNVPIKEIL